MKAILTTYHGAGGARITASDSDGNRVYIPYPYSMTSEDGHFKAALTLCRKMGWTGELAGGHLKHGMVWVWISEDKRDCNIRKVED